MTSAPARLRLDEMVNLSRRVGEPHRDLVILAEGNISMRTAADRMIVKVTGRAMMNAVAEDVVEVDLDRFWALIDSDEESDEAVDSLFRASVQWGSGRPSVESLLHAVCQRLPGIDTVIHTHPVAVNSLLCSDHAELLVSGALFPDQIVVLGRDPLLIPYVDPGLLLAREVSWRVRDHILEHGQAPRVIYLRNHGMFALGTSAADALKITEMAVKCSRILRGAASIGTPSFLSDEHAERIDTRPDELLRRRLLSDRG